MTHIKTVILHTFLTSLVLVIVAAANEIQEDNDVNVTEAGKSPQFAGTKPKLTPLEQGMQPVFIITKYFLNNILQPDTRGPPDVLLQTVVRVADPDDNISTDEMLIQLENNWQQISSYYVGFAVCLIVGLIFIIIMPIVGLCFCCCRLCGNCGGHAGQMDPKFSRCKHVTYTVFLLLIGTVMLACVICAFVTNDMLHTQIADKDRGFISNVNRSVTGLQGYMETTVQELKTDVGGKVDTGLDTISATIEQAGDVVIEQVKLVTGAGTVLDNLTRLTDDIPRLKSETTSLSDSITSAEEDATQIKDSLQSVQKEIKTALSSCLTDCTEATTKADGLVVNTNLTKIPDLNSIITALDKYATVKDDVRKAEVEFNEVGAEMTTHMQQEINNAVKQLGDAKKRIDDELTGLESQMAGIGSQFGRANTFLDSLPKDTVVENVAVFVGVGLSCLFLLIVMLLLMGLMFGVCGERAYDDARFCNKGVGANFLMSSVGFMFLTSGVLMLVTMILFLIGAPLQTEVCRHLMKPRTSSFIVRIDDSLDLSRYLYPSSNGKLTIREVLTNCENNTAIYATLKIDRAFNISKSIEGVINELDTQIKDLVGDVKEQRFADGTKILPDKLEGNLTSMKNKADFKVDFDQAIAELQKSVITMDLTQYILELEMLGMNSQQLNDAITTLKELNEQKIPQLRQKLNRIKEALVSLKRVNLIPDKITNIQTEVITVNEQLKSTNQATMQAAAERTGKQFIDSIRNLANELAAVIENDIGRCRPLYDSYFTLVSSTCEDVLNPFNSFWCAFGLCLVLFVPAIIFSVKLAGLYRKTDKYVGKPFEILGGSNVHPGDHIPMDDVRQPPPYRDTRGHAAASTGYDNSTAPPLQYGQGMLDYEMPYAVPARKGLFPPHRDNRPLLDQQL